MGELKPEYWRKAYEDLVDQTGRDLNDGLGIDLRKAVPSTSGRSRPDPSGVVEALKRAQTILANMTRTERGMFNTVWAIHDEPLRGDAGRLLPIIEAALRSSATVQKGEESNGQRIIDGLKEAVAVARGDDQPARVHVVEGHSPSVDCCRVSPASISREEIATALTNAADVLDTVVAYGPYQPGSFGEFDLQSTADATRAVLSRLGKGEG